MRPQILCIDDDRNFCEILAKAFRTEGYEVRTAGDGESGLQAIRERRPDLVTLDILLPRRDGFGVLEEIRAMKGAQSQTPVLLLSACSPNPHYRKRAAELSAAGLLTKPVALERLLALVGKSLGGGACAPARSEGSKRSSESRPIAGSLEKVPFPVLLHHLHGLRASGVLHLESGRKRKKVQLVDGRPVAVKSNLVDECLGNLLAATGKISWDVMHESLRRVKRGEGPQGQILMAMHMLDEEDLAAALRNQGEEKLSEIFAWQEGRFRFQRGVRLRSAHALTLQRSPADLIMAGVRGRLSIDAVDGFLAANARRLLAPCESPFWRFQDIELSEQEQKLLRGVDGSSSLGDLLPLPEGLRRALFGAITVGLIELRRDRGKERGRPPRRRTAAASAQPNARVAGRKAPAARRAAARPPQRKAASPVTGPPEESLRAELAGLAEGLRGKNFFSVLGIQQRTNDDEVRRAYVELAKRSHPDRFTGSGGALKLLAEEVFGIVSEAYECLRDQERRMAYLRALRNRERDAAELETGQRALRAEMEFQRGEARLRNKEHEGAVQCFEQAVHLYPEEGEYHAYLGWAWYLAAPDETGRLEEALEHVREARKLAPDSEKPYLFLGKLYKAARRGAVAERMFTRAIQLDPECVEALRELRLMDMRRGKSKGLMRRILRR